MAEMVHCDVCGKTFSSSHLKSHKRLAHKTATALNSGAPPSEPDLIHMIESLFNALSPENKQKLVKRLAERAGR
jgi:exoribonuclease R